MYITGVNLFNPSTKWSLLPHFTEKKSKAQRDPVVWQPQEASCQPHGPAALAGGCKRQKEKPQLRKTVGGCQNELWLINRPDGSGCPPERTWKDPKTASRPPRHPGRHLTFVWRTSALSTSTRVRCLQAASHRCVQTALVLSVQILRTVPRSRPPRSGT